MTLDLPITSYFRMELEKTKKKRADSADSADKEIEDLNKKVKTLLAEKPKPESREVPKELLQLRAENTNLKSELEILQSQKTNAKAQKSRLVFRLFFFLTIQQNMICLCSKL